MSDLLQPYEFEFFRNAVWVATLAGALCGLVLALLLFKLGALGGGDGKLLIGVGAFLGLERLLGGLVPGGHYLVQPTALLLRAWWRAIREGAPPSPSFADGVKTQELIDGALRSSQQGRWIDTSGARWPMAGPAL